MNKPRKKPGPKPSARGTAPNRQIRIHEDDWNTIIRAATVMTQAGKKTTASELIREAALQMSRLIIKKHGTKNGTEKPE
ncbi:MAG: hypothetical protein KDA80_19050 [Planctomycetaceae bacterium]|nr:hypothetical protein [Planctomycetaceae bacterium]